MTVHERLALAPVGIECLVDLLLNDGNGHGHIASRQPLREAHEIGRNPRTLTRKEPPRAPESRRNLVGDEEDIVFVTEGAQLPEIFLGIDAHPRTPLQERLDDHRRRLVPVRGKGTLRMLKARTGAGAARLPIGTAVAVGRLDMDVVHHHRLVHLGKEIHAPHRERADRLAVIALREAHEANFFRAPRLLAVLEGHLERRLDRRGTIVVEVELRQTLGHKRRQTLGKFDRAAV